MKLKVYRTFIGKRCILEIDPLRGMALKGNFDRLQLYNGIVREINNRFITLEGITRFQFDRGVSTVSPFFDYFIQQINYLSKTKFLDQFEKERMLRLKALKTCDRITIQECKGLYKHSEVSDTLYIPRLVLNIETVNRIACIDDLLK